jgi:hypothetical protein
MATARTFTTANFVLTLNGVVCGSLISTAGGDISADVVEVPVPDSVFVQKRIGQPQYEDFTVQIDLGMAHDVYDWVAASWAGNPVRKDGSITTADAAMNAQLEHEFSQALVTETTISGLDAATLKAAGGLTVKFSPEFTRTKKGSGKVPTGAGQKQKQWLGANFRLELDGLDCAHVRKIDSFTVTQAAVAGQTGDAREDTIKPGKLEFPNLSVTIADGPSAATWQSWFDDFVIKGDSEDSQEKNGAIVFLGADLKAELGRVVLHNVGICALRRPAREAHSESAHVLVVELYCERMELHVGKPAAPAPAPKVIDGPVRVVDPAKIIGIHR